MLGNAHLPSRSTSFIGREREIAEIGALLDQPTCRLLTLVGPGGIGKTRLAIEVASQQAAKFADGTIFVPLAPISSAENIPTAIASAFNIHLDANTDAGAQILHYLRDKNPLLVLDNFEHVLDGARLVADILQAAPDVRLLVTSREPLNLQDEWLWQVKGLPFPTDEDSTQIADYEAIQLFVERAHRVRRDFDIQSQAPDVVHICRLVEGMPLALELAAGWLKTLSCKQIGEEIQRNLDILISPARDAPSRHRSIRAIFDHSWSLLTDEQKAVFPRLSVFRGGFTLAAAERVAGASLWVLASLVDKSLLHFEDGRYTIHELLRQYGEEKLAVAGETDSAQDAHSAYFLELLAERLPDVKGRRQREALDEIDADFENIRVAWLRGVDIKDIVRLDAALDTLYIYHIDLRPQHMLTCKTLMKYGLDRFDQSRFWWRLRVRYLVWLEDPSQEIEECLLAARAQNDSAEIAFCLEHLGDSLFHCEVNVPAALSCLDEAIERFRALPDPYNLAHSLFYAGMFAHHDGDFYKAMGMIQESYETRQEIGDKIGEAWSEGELSFFTDDDTAYERHLETACQLFIQMAFYAGVCMTRFYHAMLFFYRGELGDAQSKAHEALDLAFKYNYEGAGSSHLLILAWLACIEGDYERCKHLCQKCRADTFGNPLVEPYLLAVEALAAFGLSSYTAAQQCSHTSLAVFLKQKNKRQMLACLPVSALLAAHDGQSVWACEILALAFSYPNTRTGWLHKWDLMAELRSELEHKLGDGAFAAAWERGAKMELEDAVRRILGEEPSPPAPLPHPLTAQGAGGEERKPHKDGDVPEPLTKRELEILRLIADGLQNQEIANELFIALATVKTHINAIFSKLDAANRTQAVTRARELGLLP